MPPVTLTVGNAFTIFPEEDRLSDAEFPEFELITEAAVVGVTALLAPVVRLAPEAVTEVVVGLLPDVLVVTVAKVLLLPDALFEAEIKVPLGSLATLTFVGTWLPVVGSEATVPEATVVGSEATVPEATVEFSV